MKIPSQPQGIMYEIVIIIESESKELWPLNQAAFRTSDRLHTVFLYSIAQLGCETRLSLAFKMVEISTDHMSQNAWHLSDLLGLPPNYKRVMPASGKPCLIPHQQSQSHRARTVESSRISDTLVSSRMVSPVKWQFRKEPYQSNFKQNWSNFMWYTQSLIQKIVSSSSSQSREDMWEKIQIAMTLRKIFIAKCFLQYFQCSLDMPFFDSIHIPILKNRHRVYI